MPNPLLHYKIMRAFSNPPFINFFDKLFINTLRYTSKSHSFGDSSICLCVCFRKCIFFHHTSSNSFVFIFIISYLTWLFYSSYWSQFLSKLILSQSYLFGIPLICFEIFVYFYQFYLLFFYCYIIFMNLLLNKLSQMVSNQHQWNLFWTCWFLFKRLDSSPSHYVFFFIKIGC